MLVITLLRRAFGITALARFTKSRGSETLTTSYCRRVAAMSLPLHVDGRLLLTIFYKDIAVNIVDLANWHDDSAQSAGAGAAQAKRRRCRRVGRYTRSQGGERFTSDCHG